MKNMTSMYYLPIFTMGMTISLGRHEDCLALGSGTRHKLAFRIVLLGVVLLHLVAKNADGVHGK